APSRGWPARSAFPRRTTPEKSWLTCLFGSPQKLSCTFHDRGGARSRSAADIAHSRRDQPLLGTLPAVCFAFHGGDKIRGGKVHEWSELGSEMPARRPQDPKRSGAVGVVVEYGDEQTFTKLPADGEVRQIGDTQALLGHIAQRLKCACDRRFRQFNLDAGLLGWHGPLLEPSAGRKPVVQTGMRLEVIRGFGNTFGRQIGRGRPGA